MRYLIAIPCVNRAERGASNVIEETFRSFEKSGMFESPIDFKILLFESGSQDLHYLDFIQEYNIKYPSKGINILYSHVKLNGNTNTYRMFVFLQKMKKHLFDYVMWMDDDVWVCQNFIQNADAWIRRYSKNTLFTSLYVPYPTYINPKHPHRHIAKMGSFIGTCCTVFRPKISYAVVKHWNTEYFNEFSYNPDVRFRDGLRKEFPHVTSLFVSYPSLVQHMNIGSTIRKNGQKGHTTQTFAGQDYDPQFYLKFP